MNRTSKSKWIWINNQKEDDVYADFKSEFEYDGKNAKLEVSADSNYSVFVNGVYVTSGQYPDFPHYKVYDEIDITNYCTIGKNTLAIQVWYYGVSNMSYYPSDASLRFELWIDNNLTTYSDENIMSRKNPAFQNGLKKIITSQLGYSFSYDATKDDRWQTEFAKGFGKSHIVNRDIELYPRKIKRLNVLERAQSTLVKKENNYYLFDLGREDVGYLTMKVKSETAQNITIVYGEHIADGKVRRIIEKRDFSVDVTVGKGITEYTNYFRRIGLRYLEVHSQSDVEIEFMTILPTVYPLKKIKKTFDNSLHRKIYDICVRTLELCMHDHYEDCPWREQALYTMDSRNQMLCGYYAFDEYDFPRENLYLMSKDDRKDKILSICIPSGNDLTIPSFSLHYFTQVYEYCKYSNDLTLAREIFHKLKSVINVFLGQMENGLCKNFKNASTWNFYEWTENLDGRNDNKTDTFDCALNCLLSLALSNFQKISDLLGYDENFHHIIKSLNQNIHKSFYDTEEGLYINTMGKKNYSQLVNSLAILCGASTGDEAEKICEELIHSDKLTEVSLSMVCFKYDALIMIGKEKYNDYILKNIEDKYKPMIDAGATTFWETEKGESDFDNAGSLCHGWSAMPVYYLNIIK